jgi:hypothetical protein
MNGIFLDVTNYEPINKIAIAIPSEILSLELNILPDLLPYFYKDGIYVKGRETPIIYKGLKYCGGVKVPFNIDSVETLDHFFKYEETLFMWFEDGNIRPVIDIDKYKILRPLMVYKNENLALLKEFLPYVQASYMLFEHPEADYVISEEKINKRSKKVNLVTSSIVLEDVSRIIVSSGEEYIKLVLEQSNIDRNSFIKVINTYKNFEENIKTLMRNGGKYSVRLKSDNRFVYLEYFETPYNRRVKINEQISTYGIESLICY